MRVLLKLLILFIGIFITYNFLYSQKNIDSLITLSKTTLNDSNKIVILQQISWELKYAKPTEAIKYANQALDLSRQKQYHNLEAQSLKYIATSQLLSGNYNKAENYFLAAIKIFDKVNNLEGKSSCYNNMGLVRQYKGDNLGALEAYEESLTIDKKIYNKKGEAASLSNIGNIFQKNGNYKKALENYLKSLDIRYKINDQQGIATIYNNIGGLYEKQNNYQDAIRNYKEALTKYIEIDNKRLSGLAMNNIGYILYKQKTYDEALHYFNKSIDIRVEIEDKKGLAITSLNLANLYIDQNKYEIALDYLNKSEKYYRSIDNKYEINNVKLARAKYYLKQKKYYEVIHLLNKINCSIDVLVENKASVYNMLSQVYYSIGKYKKAFLAQKRYIKLKDSIIQQASSNKIVSLQNKYEFDKKQNELEVQREKQKLIHEQEILKRKFIEMVLLTIVISSVFIIIIIYRSYLIKKKDNKLLNFQKNQNEIINKELLKYQNKLILERKQLREQQ